MNVEAVARKLSLLQDRLERSRARPELADYLEELYWGEVNRLRFLKEYDQLPGYVGWLADYHQRYRVPGLDSLAR